ncbi:MAG: inositol monophosphatase [Alphaproteobacteria bacterium]|nr:inositol monophosphatase [Alphaproteobacteria bacterium]
MDKAARRAGRDLARDFGEVEQLQVSRKGAADFVTAADRKAEATVHYELTKARAEFGFLGEEGGIRSEGDGVHRWIVDPLDGTTNFLHGLPQFAVSIALEERGQIVAGIVYNPLTDELFWAERGTGAYLNDTRLRVSARQHMSESLIATGMPFMGHGDDIRYLKTLRGVIGEVAGIRRYGSAALDLAYLAAGRFDGFWEFDLNIWDIAAGILIVREAGGFVSDIAGGDSMLITGEVVAGNDRIQEKLRKCLREADPGPTDKSAAS